MKKIFTFLVLLAAMVKAGDIQAQCTVTLIDTPIYICKDNISSKTLTLKFSGSTGTPNRYDLTWGPEAAGTGFTNRTNQMFTAASGQIGNISIFLTNTPEGIYNGTLKVYAAAPNATCVATSYALRVIVRSLPAVPDMFTVSSERVCVGSTGVPFTVPLAADPDPTASYVWSYSGSGAVINGSGNSVTVDFSNTATGGNLAVARSAKCEGGFVRNSSTRRISIEVDNAAPAVPDPFVDSTISVCQGLQYIYSVPSTAFAHLWRYTGTGTTIAANNNTAFVLFNNGATNGNVAVSAINGCDTGLERILPVTVVTAAPTQPGSFLTSADKICQKQAAVYQLPRVPGVLYQWTYSATGAAISGTGDSISIYYDQTAQSGTLEVSPSNGCGGGPSRSLPVTVYPPPQIAVTPARSTICDGDSVLLSAVTADTGLSFRWKYGNYAVPSGTRETLQAHLAGIYSVVVSRLQVDHCIDSSAPAIIDFTPAVRPEIQYRDYILHATPGLSNYQWYIGNQWLPGATDSVWTPVKEGLYRVRAADGTGCAVFSEPFRLEESQLGITDISGNRLKIYPNPAVTEVHIEAAAPVSVALYNMEGKKIDQKSGTVTAFGLHALSPGIYILRITGADGTLLRNEKLIKQAR